MSRPGALWLMECAAGVAASRRLCALEEVLSVYLEPRARSYSVSRAHGKSALSLLVSYSTLARLALSCFWL